jgi:diguanylate cyclase (GGDEF)-like protein
VIERIRRFLSGRVGRRLFLLFVLSAFVPLATIAVLSFLQSKSMLLQQGEQRLAATAKSFGMQLFERLLLLSDLAASSVAPNAPVPAAGTLARANFRSLARLRPDGSLTAIFGTPRPQVLNSDAKRRLSEGRAVLVIVPAKDGFDLVLAVPAMGGAEGIALAELAPETFWQPEMKPAATEFCVMDEESRVLLFCSAPMPETALRAAMPAQAQLSKLGLSHWTRNDENYLSLSWPQFMRLGFGTPDWLVVASQPERHILSGLHEFQRVYIPVVILTLLLVTWLTIRQSRSIVEPVAQLAERARGISRNEFAGQVLMDRQDEFGELAGALNQMSSRLGRQFAALTALSEIDKLILSTLDTVQVVRTVLERMGAVVPADFVGIMLFDRESAGHAHAYFRDVSVNEGVVFARVEVGARDREVLERDSDGAWLTLDDRASGLLGALRERGVVMAYVQPIVWREAICGALALGYRNAATASEEERQQAREFADRVAVAVSSAWRDEQLYQQAHFDSLTGLPNRLLMKDRLGQQIARTQREKRRFALLFIDIDRFKDVNDTLGHSAGDEVLREAARRVSTCVRDSDTVSRLGGDEFTVLLGNIHHPQDAGRVADDIVRALSAPFEVAGQRSFLSASVGIAAYPEDGANPEELLRNADTAMYRAKAGGRAQVVYFEERMNAEAMARLTLDRDLRQAIERGELSVHYQPLLDLASGEILGAEALLRWQHPERGDVPPMRFIPVAEESGFIDQIGHFALAAACAQMKLWQDTGLPLQRVSVNVSPRQLRKPGVLEMIKHCADDAGVSLANLELEITEGLLIDHAESVEGLLREMHGAGLRIALDDFGTGFSSMAYLNRFPIHTIKIDRVFVAGLGRSRDSQAIVQAIVAMSHALGKAVVAEGVESAEQLAFLRELGCDEIQGFHIARPMPAAEFTAFMREHADARRRFRGSASA